MLTEIQIRNFALIDDLRLEIGPGFTVLTGETGAGKSIIVDAMAAALGERTGAEVVRTGSDKCLVEAVFDVSDDSNAAAVASEYGCEPEEGLLILSREIARGGRSQCRVNGRTVAASVLREITARLIDLHGQHEHQSLLKAPLHIEILDSRLGGDGAALRARARSTHNELAALTSERERLQTDERERARLLDLYNFQANEIKAANPQPGEEEELSNERNRLANAERLRAAASEIYRSLAEESAAVDGLNTASAAAERMAQVDPSVGTIAETINAALYSAQEALLAIRDYQDAIEADPSRLEQIEDRLDLLRTLKRKYGDTIEAVLEHGAGLAAKIDELAHSEERSQELDSRIDQLRGELEGICGELTALRKSVAPEFEKAVEKELADLAMEKTRFVVGTEPAEPGPAGADAVEFLISPNPGEPVKPLAKIASGGEMSRIMLALKSVTTLDDVPTLVFDEIDAGIGGLTAQVLGEKLASLASRRQVMCVTHLPQVASKAGAHIVVDKLVQDGRTCVQVKALAGEERVRELARMLGGDEGSQAAALHAREMLACAPPPLKRGQTTPPHPLRRGPGGGHLANQRDR